MARDQFRKGIVWVDYWLSCIECDGEDVATVERGMYDRGPVLGRSNAFAAAVHQFKRDGWVLRGGYWYCPSCKE